MTHGMWQVTHDMWYMTHETWTVYFLSNKLPFCMFLYAVVLGWVSKSMQCLQETKKHLWYVSILWKWSETTYTFFTDIFLCSVLCKLILQIYISLKILIFYVFYNVQLSGIITICPDVSCGRYDMTWIVSLTFHVFSITQSSLVFKFLAFESWVCYRAVVWSTIFLLNAKHSLLLLNCYFFYHRS